MGTATVEGTRRSRSAERGEIGSVYNILLRVCIDQVDFMKRLMQRDSLRARILMWAEEQIRFSKLPPKSGRVLEAALYRGSLPRGEIAGIVGASERTQRIVLALTRAGVLTSETPRAPIHLIFQRH